MQLPQNMLQVHLDGLRKMGIVTLPRALASNRIPVHRRKKENSWLGKLVVAYQSRNAQTS